MNTAADLRDTIRLLAGIDSNTRRWSDTNLDFLITLAQQEAQLIVQNYGGNEITMTVTSVTYSSGNTYARVDAAIDKVIQVQAQIDGRWEKLGRIPVTQASDYEDASSSFGVTTKYYLSQMPVDAGTTSERTTRVYLAPAPGANKTLRVWCPAQWADTAMTGAWPNAIYNYVCKAVVLNLTVAEGDPLEVPTRLLDIARQDLIGWACSFAEPTKVRDSYGSNYEDFIPRNNA